MKEIIIGITASMFFAVTFILNRSMELDGGSWLWSSSLRFFFMLPFLLFIVLVRGNGKQVLQEMRSRPLPWLVWGTVGFGLFYAPLTYAASYGPGWLVAGTWQMTIVAGTLLAPLFFVSNRGEKARNKIEVRALCISLFILLGVVLIQLPQAGQLNPAQIAAGILPVVLAAFAYPLGNRKMMEHCGGRLDTFQRVLGMTIASLPLWVILSTYGLMTVGAPPSEQLLQTFIVGICSGVIATTLFFIATDRVRTHQGKLAAVEATQSTQVLFVMLGEVVLLSTPLPGGLAALGLFIIIAGMVLHSYFTKKLSTRRHTSTPLLKQKEI
ncbi:multidrug resistance efflux transporter family protein [Halobacillus sp. A5]|uniref:DMT family transporter n=1 Tax=Halobacillus sp. A5 TaxID=2880263 RepID=UPI0020A627A4|nr:multidrug resistance efflux transporter family protein [Halobacillus sp. A5]MCP3027488.1 multidrug resistance efflux transporter family protein [Halobacillus sp. A5]